MGTFFFGIGCSFVSCASHLRRRKADVESIARAGIKVVVCLLNDAEMRTLGMNGYMDCMKECGISGMLVVQRLRMSGPSVPPPVTHSRAFS